MKMLNGDIKVSKKTCRFSASTPSSSREESQVVSFYTLLKL